LRNRMIEYETAKLDHLTFIFYLDFNLLKSYNKLIIYRIAHKITTL
jgi:hypothetical protein